MADKLYFPELYLNGCIKLVGLLSFKPKFHPPAQNVILNIEFGHSSNTKCSFDMVIIHWRHICDFDLFEVNILHLVLMKC